ncbi:MAG: DUF2339 domain-containing protein, partial [Chrysiogenales bacterium]
MHIGPVSFTIESSNSIPKPGAASMATRIEELRERIDVLEKELLAIKAELTGPESGEKGAGAVPAVARPAVAHRRRSATGEFLKRLLGDNAEVSIGGIVIGIIGAAAFLLGAGWFIKLAIERHWLNESARIINSLLVGFGAIVVSWRLAKGGFRKLPSAVTGTGYAILYFAVFGAYYYFGLLGLKEAFLFMVSLSLASACMAGIGKSQLLYLFSLFGAYIAPLLMSQGENSYRFLFIYMTIFNVIFLFMSRSFEWKVSAYLVLFFNNVVYAGWMNASLPESSFPVPFIFISLLFTIFMLRRVFILKRPDHSKIPEDVLYLLAVVAYICMGHLTVDHFYPSFVPHFYLFVCLFLALWQMIFTKEGEGVFQRRSASLALLAMISLMLTALSMFARAPWQITAMVAVTGIISFLGAFEDRKSLIVAAIPLWSITVMVLLFMQRGMPEGGWPVLNSRFYHYLLGALFLAATFHIRRDLREFRAYGFLALFLVIVASLLENYDFVTGDVSFRRLTYSYVLLFYAFALIVPGFKLGRPLLRITGLSLIGIVIVKFYAYDMWVLALIVRIAAGLTLGIILILTALFYQKFKEKLVKTMAPTKLLFVLIFAGLALPASAEPVRIKSFKYFQEITAEKPVDQETIYGTIDLDENVYRHSWRYDLRVVHGGRALPYLLEDKQDEGKGKWGKPDVVFQRLTREGRIYVLDLPAIPEGAEYTRLAVEAGGNYEMNILVSESARPEEWRGIGTYFIHKYENESQKKTIPLRLKGRRFLRLETNSTLSLTFPGIEFRPEGRVT